MQRLFAVAAFRDKRDNVPYQRAPMSWEELVKLLTRHQHRAERDGPLWSPTLYRPKALRNKAGVLEVHCAILDFDKGQDPREWIPRWQELGLAGVIHSTYRSRPDALRWRAVFPLLRPVTGEDWEADYWYRTRCHLADTTIDPNCHDCCRMYYLPAAPHGAETFAYILTGVMLDVEASPKVPEPTKASPPPPGGYQDTERVSASVILDLAMDRIADGRNNACLWAGCQLRDNGYNRTEVEYFLAAHFWPRLPATNTAGEVEPFTAAELERVVGNVFREPARDPWTSRRESVKDEAPPPPAEEDAPPTRKSAVPEEPPIVPGSSGRRYARPIIRTAIALMKLKLPERVWAIRGYLPQGLAIFAGKPKTRKSFAVLAEAVAIATPGGKVFSSIPVETGDVLYLALEDNEESMQDRLRQMLQGAPIPERLHLSFEWPRLTEGGLTEIEDWLQAHPDARLVIVDVLNKIRPRTRNGNGNPYQEDYEVCEPLMALADKYRVCIQAVHHLRKLTSEDPLDQVLGSIGMTGAPDTVWVWQATRGQPRVTLFGTGRRIREEFNRTLLWHPETVSFTDEGDAEVFIENEDYREILAVIKLRGARTPKQVHEELGGEYPTLCSRLRRMEEKGLVTNDRGRYAANAQPLL